VGALAVPDGSVGLGAAFPNSTHGGYSRCLEQSNASEPPRLRQRLRAPPLIGTMEGAWLLRAAATRGQMISSSNAHVLVKRSGTGGDQVQSSPPPPPPTSPPTEPSSHEPGSLTPKSLPPMSALGFAGYSFVGTGATPPPSRFPSRR